MAEMVIRKDNGFFDRLPDRIACPDSHTNAAQFHGMTVEQL
jgi:hypothetical protein